jgi:hypothetical protein
MSTEVGILQGFCFSSKERLHNVLLLLVISRASYASLLAYLTSQIGVNNAVRTLYRVPYNIVCVRVTVDVSYTYNQQRLLLVHVYRLAILCALWDISWQTTHLSKHANLNVDDKSCPSGVQETVVVHYINALLCTHLEKFGDHLKYA